ncbi:protein winged eye-like isoform X1 [Daphnia carinata]|uniref:protein winged eye-like isoform X1 n=1 Tax=Daphnia carinata TaxID=120202 RepID=UPI002868DF1E|nr:protein winged eye-like isoform X1 [Daphnia carinata]
MDPESALGQLLQAAMLVGAGSTRLNTTPIVPGMKTEFPGPPPVYDGHGFGPPVILDLSPRGVDHLPSIQSPYTPVTVDGESCGETEMRIKREVKTESPDFAAGDDESEDDDQVDSGEVEDEMGGGCSRTMGRMPEASLLKWHQRRRKQQEEQSQVIQSASAMTLDSSVLSPPCDLDPAASAPKRKTLIHPQRKHNATASASSNVAIPVGIAVARQRRDKCRSDTPTPPVQPKARRAAQSSPVSSYPTDAMCMSNASIGSTDQHPFNSPSSLAGLSANYPGGRAVYNPTALYAGHPTPIAANAANWAWPNATDYSAAAAAHSLWSATDVNSIMRYSTYPPTPQPSNVSSSLLHQHHHPVGGMTPPPFLLIPTACLDPYQRAATVYWQSYAAPAQSPWGLPPDMAASPTASWALHPPVRSAFELPILRSDVTPYEDPTTHASKPACVISSPPAMAEIKEERISPEPPSHVEEKDEPSIQLERAQPLDSSTAAEPPSIRVRDNLTIGWVSRDPSIRSPSTSLDDENVPRSLSTGHDASPAPMADYSGLQLLSDSIEQFVSADQSKLANEPQTKEERRNDNVTAVEMAGNALDVLCAAALYQQSDSPQSSQPRAVSPATSCIPRPTGFQMEFDFRSKLAELQRKYKEKQKELSSLKCKKKSDKKKKQKKRSSSDKEDKAGRRRNSSSSSSRDGSHHSATKQQEQSSEPAKIVSAPVDFIVPGRLDLPSSTHRSAGVEVELPRIPTSYAAALASAANSMAPPVPANETTTVEKKKRKPDFPVRKQDSELTETIVPSKKRKFFQLFQWCHSADPTSKKNKKKNSSGHDAKSPMKPKIKPKLKAEVQVKQLNSSSSDESEEELKADEEDVLEEDSDRLERHCLPALQFLQLNDDSGAEIETIPVASPLPPAPSPPPPPVPPTPPPLVAEPVIEIPVIDPEPKISDPEPNDSTSASTIKSPWLLTQDLLQDGLRVLIAEEGLFHGGSVSGIRPPDIYGVVVDGERGSRPRILSTEELLHEALLEVCPIGLNQLPVGTRVCGYWSRKSRCLYPGVVSNVHPAGPPNNAGSRNVTREDEIDVEFDDGDSGRIPVSQIRLLPPDYPVLERDPNPLLKIESRRHKRRISEPAPILVAAVKPSVHQELAQVIAEEVDEPAKKNNKKAEGDESKENNDDGNVQLKKCKKSKKHKKKHKKKRQADAADETLAEQPDLIIPISPGLTIDHAVESAEANDGEPIVKMETRGSKEAVNYSASPIPRRSAAKTKSPEPQQVEQQPRKANKSKMAAFLPERQLWQWLGASFKKASKGKGRKEFYKAIHRGDEIIRVGDCAVFLSAGRPDRPYVGRIELLWQSWGGSMTVKVRWFYHPEETCGGRRLTHLKIPGALFESNHVDENDVQTISHCCTVSSLDDYRLLCKGKPDVNLNLDATYSSGYDQFYLAGFYDPTSGHLSFESDVLEQQQ